MPCRPKLLVDFVTANNLAKGRKHNPDQGSQVELESNNWCWLGLDCFFTSINKGRSNFKQFNLAAVCIENGYQKWADVNSLTTFRDVTDLL